MKNWSGTVLHESRNALAVIVHAALGDDTRENLQELYGVTDEEVRSTFMGLANDVRRLRGGDSRG